MLLNKHIILSFFIVFFTHLGVSAITITSQAQLEAIFDSTWTQINDNLHLEGLSIVDLSPLKNVHTISGNFSIHRTGLTNTEGLESLYYALRIFISENEYLEEIHLPSFDEIWGEFDVRKNPALLRIIGSYPSYYDNNYIRFSENPQLEDIGILNDITFAGSLYLYECPSILDLAPLSNLQRVEYFRLKNFPLINDLLSLSNLIEARTLELDEFPLVQDVTSLSGIDVEELELFEFSNFDQIKDINVLQLWDFPIREIKIEGNNKLKNLSGLSNIESVEKLIISGNDSLTAINFDQLETADHIRIVDNNELVYLNGLNNLDSLGCGISITDNPKLESLIELSNLKKANGGGCDLYHSWEVLYLKNLPSLKSENLFLNLEEVHGDLVIENCGMDSLYGFGKLQWVEEHVEIFLNHNLIDINSFSNLEYAENFLIADNSQLEKLIIPNKLGMTNLEIGLGVWDNAKLNEVNGGNELRKIWFYLGNNPQLYDFPHLENLNWFNRLRIENTRLKNLDFISSVDTAGGWIDIKNNLELESIEGLANVTKWMSDVFGDHLEITDNPLLETISPLISYPGPETGRLEISNNHNLFDLVGLDSLKYNNRRIRISGNDNLQNLDGISQLKNIRDSLIISNNSSLTDISALASLDSLGEYLKITNNPLLSDCEVLCTIDSSAYIAEGIILENNADFCSVLDSVLYYCENPVAIYETNKYTLDIFPNPSFGIFDLSMPIDLAASYTVSNSTGQQISNGLLQRARHAIDISEASSGIYFLSLYDEEGKVVGVEKIVKY